MCSIISSSPIKHGVEFLFQVDAENYFKSKHKKSALLYSGAVWARVKHKTGTQSHRILKPSFCFLNEHLGFPRASEVIIDCLLTIGCLASFWLARQPHHPDLCVSACAQECIHLCVCVFACVPCREACELWIMCFTVWCPLDICL